MQALADLAVMWVSNVMLLFSCVPTPHILFNLEVGLWKPGGPYSADSQHAKRRGVFLYSLEYPKTLTWENQTIKIAEAWVEKDEETRCCGIPKLPLFWSHEKTGLLRVCVKFDKNKKLPDQAMLVKDGDGKSFSRIIVDGYYETIEKEFRFPLKIWVTDNFDMRNGIAFTFHRP